MEVNLSDSIKRELLKIIQKEFPLEERPFLKIAQKLNIGENEVIEILRDLQKNKIIRQISAIFNPWFFGHQSALFAFEVPLKRIKEVASIINRHPGVTHNYLRNHKYNLWFILVSPPERNLLEEVKKLASICKIKKYLYLPALRIFKISTVFEEDFTNFEKEESIKITYNFTEWDKILVKKLQEPLALVENPFKEIANSLGIDQKELFSWIKKMKQKGGLRRFGALLKHDKVGFKTNVMIAWEIEKEKIDSLIEKLSKHLFITHCYERKSYPYWKYNFYTMCHFKREQEKEKIYFLAQELDIKKFLLLETLKEFKKIRLKLFYD